MRDLTTLSLIFLTKAIIWTRSLPNKLVYTRGEGTLEAFKVVRLWHWKEFYRREGPRGSPTSNVSHFTDPELQREATYPKLMCPDFYCLFHYLAYVLYSTCYGNWCLSSGHRNTEPVEIHQVWQPPLIPSLWEAEQEASLGYPARWNCLQLLLLLFSPKMVILPCPFLHVVFGGVEDPIQPRQVV